MGNRLEGRDMSFEISRGEHSLQLINDDDSNILVPSSNRLTFLD